MELHINTVNNPDFNETSSEGMYVLHYTILPEQFAWK